MSDRESDHNTTVHSLRELVQEFVQERDWKKHHSPKNLSMSIAIEAAELMEHFQWRSVEESRQIADDVKAEVAEELADVICYALGMANELGLDVSTCMREKMVKNRIKYPIGSSGVD